MRSAGQKIKQLINNVFTGKVSPETLERFKLDLLILMNDYTQETDQLLKSKIPFMGKKADKIINLRIDVSKINKEWLYKGEKGTYLDLTYFYSEEKDQYKNNGMIVQSVPSDVYKKAVADKLTKEQMPQGAILGNGSVYEAAAASKEGQPGYRGETKKEEAATEEAEDDLPF